MSKHKGLFSFIFCFILSYGRNQGQQHINQLHNFLDYIQLQEHTSHSMNIKYYYLTSLISQCKKATTKTVAQKVVVTTHGYSQVVTPLSYYITFKVYCVFSAKTFSSHNKTSGRYQLSLLSEEFTYIIQFNCILHAKHVKKYFSSDLGDMTHKKHTQ